MKRMLILAALAAAFTVLASDQTAFAGPPGYDGFTAADNWMYYHAQQSPWHGQYRHTAFGKPVSLVVPPTANLQTNYSWGVPSSRVTPIYHQFGRSYPQGVSEGAGQFMPTPYWPSHTDQFGVYYVRGPW
jgi:hypothetical protein